MPSANHIPSRLQAALSHAQATVVAQAISVAHAHGLPLYLVGGGVRDLLMGRPINDLDLVAEGDPVPFTNALAQRLEGRIAHRSQFGTARLQALGLGVDIVMARTETYLRPGALPTVSPGMIIQDMWRRDFTIHAIALRLSPPPSDVLDPTGGLADLAAKHVRVLHSRSFQDDATRILRAVRYEQRLAFSMEPGTEGLLRRDLSYLDTISGDRLRRELGLAFQELCAPDFLRRAAELGLLSALHHLLPDEITMDARLSRLPLLQEPPPPLTYLALLSYSLDSAQRQALASRFNMPRAWEKVLQDTAAAELGGDMSSVSLPSQASRRFQGLALEAIQATAILSPFQETRQLALRYLKDWRRVRPLLKGTDLLRLGVPEGPKVKEALLALRDARLDGQVRTREEEEAFCKALASRPPEDV
ncbi:MAG: CCA tRNA nucleotidyltransferase [Chloroflexi bacterium]|nr:CCA tRNA nucleotidyltransferase [Chloroflexota bacterium]